jgi:hypothetical protein
LSVPAPDEVKELKNKRATGKRSRNNNNFIPEYLTGLEPDSNIKTNQESALNKIICVKNKITLIYNLVIVCDENLEGMSCRTYFPSQSHIRFWLHCKVLMCQKLIIFKNQRMIAEQISPCADRQSKVEVLVPGAVGGYRNRIEICQRGGKLYGKHLIQFTGNNKLSKV